MMHGNWFSGGHHMFWGNSYWNLLLYAVVAIVIVVLIYIMKKKKLGHDSPMTLLKTQYVNGHITEEEYVHRKDVIERK